MPTALEIANANLARARAQVAEAQAADARAAAQVHDPRAAEVVLKDILDYIAMRLGNRGDLRALLEEYFNAVKVEAKAPEPQ